MSISKQLASRNSRSLLLFFPLLLIEMNPYVADPDNIPPTDRYADVPFYGRYLPRQDDFRVDPQHINSQTTASLEYWASVLNLCNESVRIYPADEGGRDVFALGTVIIKSSHLHDPGSDQPREIDYSYADANEVQAIAIAKGILKDVKVPEIFFAGKVFAHRLFGPQRFHRLPFCRSMDGRYLSRKDSRASA